MKKLILISILAITLIITSCSKDNCLEDKQAEIEKYDRLIQQAQNDPSELEIIYRNREISLSQFNC